MPKYQVTIEKIFREVWHVEARSKGDAAYAVGKEAGEQIEAYQTGERVLTVGQVVADDKLPLA